MSVNKEKSTWRLTTPGGIKVKVKERSGSFEREAANAQEVYIIRASDLYSFILESFPLPYTFLGTVSYPSVRRMPSFPAFQSVRVSWSGLEGGALPVDPFGSDPSGSEHYDENLVVTIDYSTSNGTGGANESDPDPNDPLTFLELNVSSGGSFIYTPSRGSLKWEGEGDEADIEIKDRDVPITVPQPEVEWTLKWSQIPFTFFDETLVTRLRSRLGKVNSAVMPVFFDAPAETILFLGWSLREQFTWRPGLAGKPPLDLELKFSEKNFTAPDGVQVTHNHFYRSTATEAEGGNPAAKIGWRKVIVDTSDGDKYVYDSIDLNVIFAP